MDAILLNGGIYKPRTLSRSIGPYKIAHWIRKHGYQCQIIDFCDRLTQEQLFTLLRKFVTTSTKIIGLSTTFIANGTTYNSIDTKIINALVMIKELNPTIKIVVGGWLSETVSSHGIIDATIMSYSSNSEDIFLEYLEYLNGRNEAPLGKLISVSGDKKMRMWFDTARNPIYKIATDDFKFVEQDCILPGEPLPLDVSRGCIFACKFCSFLHIGKKKYDYVRDMSYIEDELNYNWEKFGTKHYYVLDDTFNDTVQKLSQFSGVVERLKQKINYTAYIRADLVHRFPETAYMLRESGLTSAKFGIETLHPKASKIIGKAWSGQHAREFLPKLHHEIWNDEINTTVNIITGLPEDTVENLNQTVNWFIEGKLSYIGFTGLYLTQPSETSTWNQSEFSRNYATYGIEHVYDGEKYVGWRHGNFWNTDRANEIAKTLNTTVKPYLKMHAWSVPSIKWYGLDPKNVTQNHLVIPHKNQYFLDQYYNLIMSV